MIKNLKQKLQFIELMDKMKDIERTIFLRNGKQENDAEHSFHLAMMVITFADDFPILNIEKCLKLALIHDIVEIYAGDTPTNDKKIAESKKEREHNALKRLEKEFGDVLPEFIALIQEYEGMESSEAKFVTTLDKIQPIMQVTLEGGQAWKDFKIDFEMIKKRQYSKVYPEFGLEKILDIYFEKAEKEDMCYRENK